MSESGYSVSDSIGDPNNIKILSSRSGESTEGEFKVVKIYKVKYRPKKSQVITLIDNFI
jgi:hypothetical protein